MQEQANKREAVHTAELEKKAIAEQMVRDRATHVRDDFAMADNLDRETTEEEERVMNKKIEMQRQKDAARNTITNPLAMLGQLTENMFSQKDQDRKKTEKPAYKDKKEELFKVDYELKEFHGAASLKEAGDFLVTETTPLDF